MEELQRAGSKLEYYLSQFADNLLIMFRTLSLWVVGVILRQEYVSLETDSPISPDRFGWVLFLLIIFGLSFQLEIKDIQNKSFKEALNQQLLQRAELFNYYIREYIPTITDLELKLKVTTAISNLMDMVNITNIRKDMGAFITAQTQTLSNIVEDVLGIKDDIAESLKSIIPPPRTRKEMSSTELDKIITDNLEKKEVDLEAPLLD